MSRVFVIGCGAAGMMAAIAAAENGNEVHVFEKNEKAGKKIYITGKGRCNFTNASNIDTYLSSIKRNGRFLYSAFSKFFWEDISNLLEENGIHSKIERGNRVFPSSDKSSDVIKGLKNAMGKTGVNVHYNCRVDSVIDHEEGVSVVSGANEMTCDKCIISTGGLSYPSTGSTGDGYRFAKENGIKVTKTYPSLTGFNINEKWCAEIAGLSLKNVGVCVRDSSGKKYYGGQGEMLFTHYGVSGPLILSASTFIADIIEERNFNITIDLKPALSADKLDDRILRDFDTEKNKNFENSLGRLLPRSLIPVAVSLSGINPQKKVRDITKKERLNLVELLKSVDLHIDSLRGYDEAIITRGGVDIREIDPGTMKSKNHDHLYFAGEVLDLDGTTGGFNLQIAWSTGYLAGKSV